MPIMLRVDELEPGMVLANSIINRFCVLLARGRRLTEYDISALRRKMPEALVPVIDPVLDEVVDFQEDAHDRQVSSEVRRNIASVVRHVGNSVRAGMALEGPNVAGMQAVVQEMIRYLEENPVTMAIIEQSARWNAYLQEHSANVFYVSLVIGNTLRNYVKQERERCSALRYIPHAMDLTPLATAALFHDLGMVPIEHLYKKSEPLTDHEKALVRAHPQRGAELLPAEIDPMTRLVVRTHHENQDGSGYPQGLHGEQITVFARILRVADAYAAAISRKAYHKAKSPIRALYEMLHGDYARLYDPVILKVFASITQPLPIGAKLKLANGQWAVVVAHNRANPFKPQIIIAFDELGDPLERSQLRPPFYLGERSDVRIAYFAGEDLHFLNDLPDWHDDVRHVHLERLGEELLDFMYP